MEKKSNIYDLYQGKQANNKYSASFIFFYDIFCRTNLTKSREREREGERGAYEEVVINRRW